MSRIDPKLDHNLERKLKLIQSRLGTEDLESTKALMLSLGVHVFSKAALGGQIGRVKGTYCWTPIHHPALDKVREKFHAKFIPEKKG